MSQQTSEGRPYWFSAVINRNGHCVHRTGTVIAKYAYGAALEVRKLAREDWKQPLMELCIYGIEEDGTTGNCLLKQGGQWGPQHNQQKVETKPQPRPWEFGTAKHQQTFATLNLEE